MIGNNITVFLKIHFPLGMNCAYRQSFVERDLKVYFDQLHFIGDITG